jgi:purine catabolism regulator
MHHELIVALLADPSAPDVARRVEVAGIAPGGRLVGVALRPAAKHPALAGPSYVDDIVAALLRSAESVTAQVLVAAFEGEVRALVSLPPTADQTTSVDRLVEGVRTKVPVVAAAGTPVARLAETDRTLRDAVHVLAAVPDRPTAAVGVHRLEDLHVRGLLMLLSEDERLRGFVDRELAPLHQADERHREDLLRTARALVARSGNKAAAAAELNVSRPALYDRIRRLESILGTDLDDGEVRTSLHLALLATELREGRRA